MANLVFNNKATFDFEILEKFTAGIELLGFEVKSIRNHQGSLLGSYVTIRGGEAYLINTNIPAFQPNNTPKDFDPLRNRRLLLTKKEISSLASYEAKKGLTIVPISMYNSGRKIKVEIAVARGKKKFDKRETLKKRDAKREMDRALKNQ